jgi:glyoxylase-like metal-dependent hydrolase (beta-lactamase superfamily II)
MPDDLFSQLPTDTIDPRIHIFRRLAAMPGEIELLQVDCYGIVTERFIALCDTSLNPHDSATMLQTLHNSTDDRAIFVINSHADWDHVWGNGTFASTPSIPIIAHHNALARWQSDEMQTILTDFQRYPIFKDVVFTPPTLTFTDTLTLHGGDLTLELFYAPGHQPDHIAIWIAQLRLLLAFDAVEYPFLTLESATSVPAMIATLEHFIRLAPASILCSHGETTDAALIQHNLNYIRLIEQKCRTFLASHPSPSASELEHASRLIDYPWQDAVPAGGVVSDGDFYSLMHDQNTRAIMQWVMSA